MRLDTISLPSNQLVFSEEYQNTKMSFSFEPYSSAQVVLDIEIDEGSYTPQQLATEIQTKMNARATAPPASKLPPYDGFVVKYNEIDNTFWFGNIRFVIIQYKMYFLITTLNGDYRLI